MIQQVAFEVPADIALKLAAGEYVQYGGVVRDLSGRIVKHLKPAAIQKSKNAAQELASQAVQFARQNKKFAIGAFSWQESPPWEAPSMRASPISGISKKKRPIRPG